MSELRIVAGEWRGRRIKVPPGAVRPTADKVREAWMSIIRPALDGARVVDLCAGSGALGLEALSRGAAHCDFVEEDPAVRRALESNIAALGAAARATVHRSDALRFVDAATVPWDVAFADPPYGTGIALGLAERWLRTPFATIFGAEHEAGLTLPSSAAGVPPDRRVYGLTALTLYRQPS
jgi:16S rRNA (guanine966-N2)-methyltransferase